MNTTTENLATDEIRNALNEAAAEARLAQRFGDRITFMYQITDPVIVDYHVARIHADYDLSAARLAGHTYTIGRTMLVGRFENSKADRENHARWTEMFGAESANEMQQNHPILVTEVITDRAIGYASNYRSAYGIICAAQRTDGITYYGRKGFASRFGKKGNQVGDGRHIITTIFKKSGNSKKPYNGEECRSARMAWMFGDYTSEVKNCAMPSTSTYVDEKLICPSDIRAVWDARSNAKKAIAQASDEIIRATEIANGAMTSGALVDDILQHIKEMVVVQ